MVHMRLAHSWNSANRNSRWKITSNSGRYGANATNTPAEENDSMSNNLNCSKNTQVLAIITKSYMDNKLDLEYG